jgi:hypothetical protein
MTTEREGKEPRPTAPATENERLEDELIEDEDDSVAAHEAEEIADEDAAAAADARSGRIPAA